jgi:signal transduction histidine kinase
MIERNVGIISDLVKDLLNFAKERTPEYEEVDPRTLIEDLLADTGAREPDHVELRAEVPARAGKVMLDVHAFRQCLGNLVRNAIEAIPPDRAGTVRVGYAAEGVRAVFTVRDDGVGMSPEIIEKVRGGMYSTKGSKGTGLGLLVAQKIVTEHAGALTIESEEGRGSTFRIEIPVGGAAPPGGPAEEPGSRSRTAEPATSAG